MARAAIEFRPTRGDKRPATPAACKPFIDLSRVREIVARTRAEQGLPPTITDPAAIARLATLVAAVSMHVDGHSATVPRANSR